MRHVPARMEDMQRVPRGVREVLFRGVESLTGTDPEDGLACRRILHVFDRVITERGGAPQDGQDRDWRVGMNNIWDLLAAPRIQ